jgi:hypothetical protein
MEGVFEGKPFKREEGKNDFLGQEGKWAIMSHAPGSSQNDSLLASFTPGHALKTPPPEDELVPDEDGVDRGSPQTDGVLSEDEEEAFEADNAVSDTPAIEDAGKADVTAFTNFKPMDFEEPTIDNKLVARMGQIKEGADLTHLKRLWLTIYNHVKSGKPVFFICTPSGIPSSFYKKHRGATKSIVYRGSEDIMAAKLPEGQFHFGLITGNKAIEGMQKRGFLMVACSGSPKYYSNNLKGDKKGMTQAMTDHKRITFLKNTGIIHGFINKPCPALDILIDFKSKSNTDEKVDKEVVLPD